MRAFVLLGLAGAIAFGASVSCKSADEPESKPYFDRTIGPILAQSCSRQTTGCHQADPRGNAVGNLDTSSFDMLDRRRDLLVTYGPYQSPGLLAKVSGPQTVPVSTLDGTVSITTDIRHAAASGIDVTSDGYATLRRWMDGGATRNNVGPSAPHLVPSGSCRKSVPEQAGFDPKSDPGPAFGQFVDKVQPVLAKNCSAASCHGNDVAQFSLTCGESEEQRRWNFWIASQFVAAVPEASEIARRPLDPGRGGVYHEGGVVFDSTGEESYKSIVEWAKVVGPPKTEGLDAGFRYFANRVQPTLVRKGCMFLGCHSPSMFHDLRLSGGSGGQFSIAATRRNYSASKLMLAVEAPDANVSRLINKNLFPYDRDIDDTAVGTRHRGGALLDDLPAGAKPTLAACKTFDLDKGDLDTTPGYCILARWHQIEREAAIKKGAIDAEPLRGIVYVSRPPSTDVPQAFDTYRAGASLHLAGALLGADGTITISGDTDLTAGCGLSEASADIRGPAVSWDGKKIAFAARTSATTQLAIYVMNADGTSCAKHDKIGAHEAQKNGILVHDFDPAYAPDGRLVFASTRGAVGQSDLDYDGPTRTPSTMLPNSNIYVLDEGSTVRQLSFLLNAELAPSFMLDGRIIYTTEKRGAGFYQLAGRRQNLDGGDYHPFYGQRKSLGFEQTTEVAELADRNFVAVFSDHGALAGAGAVGVINRSLGPDQAVRDPADRFYLKSLHLPDVAANGKAGSVGAYRSPSPLPTHGFLASYAGRDPYAFDGGFDLVHVDERTGARKVLITRPAGKSIVEAVGLYARANLGVFKSKIDEVNGAVQVASSRDAEARVLDLPMLASLMFSNTREGRNVDDTYRSLGLLESLPPPAGALGSFDGLDPAFVGTDEYGKFWAKRRRLGIADAYDDHSIGFHIPGGMPFVLELYNDGHSKVLATQKEEGQLVPGELARVNFRRELFGAQCGGCHGSISGREVDVHLVPDLLTSASRVQALQLGALPAEWVIPKEARSGLGAIGPEAK